MELRAELLSLRSEAVAAVERSQTVVERLDALLATLPEAIPEVPTLPEGVREVDIDCAVRTLLGECRGEPERGIEGVCHVILNRWCNPRWWSRAAGEGIPDHTIEAVCRKPYQFSCWLDSDPNAQRIKDWSPDDPTYQKLRAIFLDCLTGARPDPTASADHYVRTDWIPRTAWAKGRVPTTKIGAHSFFRLAT